MRILISSKGNKTLYQLCVFSLATVVRAVNFGNWRNLKMIGYVLAPGA